MRRSAIEHELRLQDRYKLLGKIGEGTYGLVFKAEPLEPKEGDEVSYAVKMVKSHKEVKNDVVLSMATLREIKLLRELRHENIVYLIDVHVDPREKSLALVFEYAHHDLRDIIMQSKQNPLSEYTKKSLMYQILKGVKYMHDNWILHRDMKPQNILVVGQGKRKGQVKIADFGLARIYQSPVKALSDVERVVVTLWYRAPELLLGAKHYTTAVDIWATGCIFAEIINLRELFCGKEVEGTNAPFQKDQCDKIFKVLGVPTPATWKGVDKLPEYRNLQMLARERKYASTTPPGLRKALTRSSESLVDLLGKMLEMDPEIRITAEEALKHPYFTEEPKVDERDRAFDEPGQPSVHFKVQQVVPIEDNSLLGRNRIVPQPPSNQEPSSTSNRIPSQKKSGDNKRPWDGNARDDHRDNKVQRRHY